MDIWKICPGVYVLLGEDQSVDVAFETVCFPQFEKGIDVLERSVSRREG